MGLKGLLSLFFFHCWMNSMWGLDLLQTGSQSLSSQQPTSLSATLAVTKSIMFSLLCCFWHHSPCQVFFFFFSPFWFDSICPPCFQLFSRSVLSLLPRQQAKQRRKVYLFEKCQVNPFSERSLLFSEQGGKHDVSQLLWTSGECLYHSVVRTNGLRVSDAHGVLSTTRPVFLFPQWFSVKKKNIRKISNHRKEFAVLPPL